MPIWTNEPPAPSDFAGIRLLRVTTGHWLEGTITSNLLAGTYTHYHHGRTQPCDGPNCQMCLQGLTPRWHGYFSYYHPATHRISVLEITALTAQTVTAYQKRVGTLRGAHFIAQRTGKRANAPVTIELKATDADRSKLPSPVDLEAFLTHLWTPTARTKPATQRDLLDDEPNADATNDARAEATPLKIRTA